MYSVIPLLSLHHSFSSSSATVRCGIGWPERLSRRRTLGLTDRQLVKPGVCARNLLVTSVSRFFVNHRPAYNRWCHSAAHPDRNRNDVMPREETSKWAKIWATLALILQSDVHRSKRDSQTPEQSSSRSSPQI